jgi:hypothetical protein
MRNSQKSANRQGFLDGSQRKENRVMKKYTTSIPVPYAPIYEGAIVFEVHDRQQEVSFKSKSMPQGVVLMFREYNYAEMSQAFGDVKPVINTLLTCSLYDMLTTVIGQATWGSWRYVSMRQTDSSGHRVGKWIMTNSISKDRFHMDLYMEETDSGSFRMELTLNGMIVQETELTAPNYQIRNVQTNALLFADMWLEALKTSLVTVIAKEGK